jgi:hypothetical protein
MWGIVYENKILVGNSERKRLLERPGHRCEGNIKMDVRFMEWYIWIGFVCLRI